MGQSYDFNFHSIELQANSLISSCSYNTGEMKIGENSQIAKCNYNSGKMDFGESSKIEAISFNCAHMIIGNNSHITRIKYNCGTIILGSNCKVDNVKFNCGTIIGGPGSNIAFGKCSPGTITIQDGHGHATIHHKSHGFSGSGHGQEFVGKEKPIVPVLYPVVPTEVHTPSAPDPEDPEKGICSICQENPRSVVFGCGHICCEKCSRAIIVCHMCRKDITHKIKIYY